MNTPLLKLDNLSKFFRNYWTFRPIQAVRNVSLEVDPGESVGFLGHNGAGKTTTIKCIVDLIHPSAGNILYRGESLAASRRRAEIGYLPEQPYFYDHLSVQETLQFFASLYGLKGAEARSRVKEVLEMVRLVDRGRSRVRTLSKGLQQRLGLAQAILNRPKLLLLDEPFSGLDPLGRIEVRKLILKLREAGTTIFLSSHILPDVEDICDRIAILARGELKSVFELKDMGKLFGEGFELSCLKDASGDFPQEALLENTVSHQETTTSQGTVLVCCFNDSNSAQRALSIAAGARAKVLSFRSVGLSLEDVFVRIAGDSATGTPDADTGRRETV